MHNPSIKTETLQRVSQVLAAISAFAGVLTIGSQLLNIPPALPFFPILTGAVTLLCLALPLVGGKVLYCKHPRYYQGGAVLALLLGAGYLVYFLVTKIPKGPHHPFLLPPHAAFLVCWLAAATLVLPKGPRGAWIGQSMTLVSLALCTLALSGYLYGTEALARIDHWQPMTWPVAAWLSLISLSLLCAWPDQAFLNRVTSDTLAGMIARRSLLPVVLLPSVITYLIHLGEQWEWYSVAFGRALLTFATVTALLILGGWQIALLYRAEMTRRRLASNLAQLEHRYTLLVQSVKDYAICTLDTTGRIVSCNPCAEKIKGYSIHEAQGRDYQAFFTEDTQRAGLPRCLLETARQQGCAHFQGWNVRRDGSRFYAQENLSALIDENGVLLGFAQVTQDITQRKQVADEKIRLQTLLDTVHDAILVFDQHGILNTVNPSAMQIFGYREHELRGQPVTALIVSFQSETPDQALRHCIDAARHSSNNHNQEVMARHQDGTLFPAELSVSEMVLEDTTNFTVIVRDISLRKAAEQTLRQSEQRLALAMAIGKIGIWELEVSTGRLSICERLDRMLGQPAEPPGTLTDWQWYVWPEDQPNFEAALDPLLAGTSENAQSMFRVRNASGHVHWLQARIQVLQGKALGNSKRLLGVMMDIHEQKETELALRNSQQDLAMAMQGAHFYLWHFHVPTQRFTDVDSLVSGLGYAAEENTHRPDFWERLLPPEDLEKVQTLLSDPRSVERLEKGLEVRFRQHDSRPIWMLVRAQVVNTDASGAPETITGTCLDIDDIKQAEAHVLHLAQHDSLTGLPNRALTFALGEQLLASLQRHSRKVAILFIDLDRFKPINDTYGHDAGDAVLRGVAERLRTSVRAGDIIGRLGGDEFLVVLPDLQQASDAGFIAQACLDAVGQSYHYRDFTLQVSPSIGISLAPDDGRHMALLVKHADTAMYHAKEAGRNQFQFFMPAMNVRAKSLLSVENRLRRSIEREELVLHYQPVVDTQSYTVTGAEALLRWPQTQIGPEDFIPIAESSGLILPLGEWVLREACQQCAKWNGNGVNGFRMSVNISPVQIRQKSFSAQVARIVEDTRILPAWLQLEITENIIVRDINEAARLLDALREKGLQVALDDFGKGYSSLHYLKQLPLDVVKVDRQFVQALRDDQVNQAITEAIITLGQRLGLCVIAEGIESREVLELLHLKNCHQMQGFYFGQPMPASDFEAWHVAFIADEVPLH